jgi:hypothetical protein
MKKQFALLDICYPDYFTGYHRTVIGILIEPNMTNKMLVDAIRLELNYIETDYSKTEYLIIEEYLNTLMEDPEQINHPDSSFNLDEDPEIYAYFSLIKPVYQAGIIFLDR